MKRVVILAAAFVLLVSSPAQCEQFPLKYQDAGSPPYVGLVRAVTAGSGAFAPAYKPAAVPGGLTGGASFFQLKMRNDSTLMLLMDPAKVPLLYVDVNRNNDFTDAPKYEGKLLPKGKASFPLMEAALFGPVSLPLGPSDSAGEYKVYIEVSGRDLMRAYPAGVVAGEISLGSRRVKVAVVDDNFNGRYNDTFLASQGCDMLAIDMDGDGKFDSDGEKVILTRMIPFNGDYFSIDLAPDGSALTVEKVTPKKGTLKAPAAGVNVQLLSENGRYDLNGSVAEWELPVGHYFVLNISLDASDNSGNWRIEHTGRLGRGKGPASVDIKENETTDLEAGPPLVPQLSAETRPNEVLFALTGIAGKGGETYSALVKKNGAPAPAPKFEIVDESGKVLASGTLEYG